MSLRIGRPRVALIVAPHPDDEIIGAGHLIAALVRRGCRVIVAIVTDGSASHPGSLRCAKADLVKRRRFESRLALRRLGVPAIALHFIGLPDGQLSDQPARCGSALRRMVAGIARLDLIVGPDRDDEHPDHRIVAAELAGAPGRARRLAYRVWPPRRSQAGGRVALVGPSHAAKRSLIRVYRTQTGSITDDPAGFAMARHELAAFAHPIERFTEARR